MNIYLLLIIIENENKKKQNENYLFKFQGFLFNQCLIYFTHET